MEKGEKSVSLSEEENKILDDFSSVMASNLMTTSKEPYSHIWPAPVVNILEARWYSLSHFPRTLFSMIQKLEKRGFADEAIAKLFGGPSRICLFLFWVDGKRLLRMKKLDISKLALKLIKYISCYRHGDIYCRDGKNLILDQESLRHVLEDFHGIRPDRNEKFSDVRESVARINAALWLYTELLYLACHSWGHEFHGPYELENGRSLVIREYYDLKPPFWDFSQNMMSDKITTAEIYEKAEIAFDMLNRNRSKGLPIIHLRDFGIKLGGPEGEWIMDVETLQNIESRIVKIAEQASEYEAKLTKKDLITKFNEATFYCGIKPLADVLGEQWRMPDEIYEMIDREDASRSEFLIEKLEGIRRPPEAPPEVLFKILKDSFDPRV